MLASSFLSELGGLMGRRILHSPPRCQFEDTAQLIRDLCGRLRQAGAAVVMMHARFEDPADHIEGQFFLFPETESVARLTRLAEG
jgi:chemotaxis protein CheY-P-specific phosphatase CheC